MSQLSRSRRHGLGAKLVLSIFPGIDLLGRAFEETGLCVVRGPDLITGGDIRDFHAPAGRFDGVIGGPPCQDFSALNRNPQSYSREMINQFCRVVEEASPDWFLFENVVRAPALDVEGYSTQRFALDLAWFSEFSRRRDFVFGSKTGHSLNPINGTRGAIAGTCVTGSDERSFSACCEIQGLPAEFDVPFFTLEGKKQAVANAVPLPMSRHVAQLIAEAVYGQSVTEIPGAASHRKCLCGCGRAVLGRASYAGPACRKRAQRAREAASA